MGTVLAVLVTLTPFIFCGFVCWFFSRRLRIRVETAPEKPASKGNVTHMSEFLKLRQQEDDRLVPGGEISSRILLSRKNTPELGKSKEF